MESIQANLAPSQARNFQPGQNSCKRCASTDLFIKQQGMHLGLFCRDCDLWQKWVRKGEARRYQGLRSTPKPYTAVHESVRTSFSEEPTDLSAEIDDLKKRILGIERQLTVLTRIEANGGLQRLRQDSPGVFISDDLVNKLVDHLAGEFGDEVAK
jgi:hypothetical protein